MNAYELLMFAKYEKSIKISSNNIPFNQDVCISDISLTLNGIKMMKTYLTTPKIMQNIR